MKKLLTEILTFLGITAISIGAITVRPTSSLIFNIITLPLNVASTTLCSIQNISGVDRVLTGIGIDLKAGTSANIVNSVYRGYTSAKYASVLTSSTVFQGLTLASSTINQVFGNTTTLYSMWSNTNYVSVTSSVITSSTGNCVLTYYNF